jgi:hypothetical protein
MKTIMFTLLAFSTITVFGNFSATAQARDFALHFAGPGYHVDVGGPRYGYYGHSYGRYRDYDYGYGGYYRGGHAWHDTSHYDYHPGGWVRHWDHYDYVPGHYDYHPSGHWDHYHW